MSPLIHRCAGHDRQRGAIGLIAALTLALALLCMLIVVDSGRLYLEKRSLQRVADMSALEAAGRNGNCIASGTAVTYAMQSATRNGFTLDDSRSLNVSCGTLVTGADSRRAFIADATRSDAIQVIASHAVPRSIAAGIGAMFSTESTPLDIRLSATAVASPPLPPLASLTIKSTLVTVDSTKAGLLNALWGGLLGGTLNISVAGWNGLTNANINLLSYLDQLAIDIGVRAGDYTALLGTDISVAQLLNTSIKVLPQNGSAVQAAINSLLDVGAIAGDSKIKLGDLLSVQTGLPSAGLDTNLNLLGLIQGFIQVANSDSALFATLPANLLGLAGITVKIKVIEPPRLSALGNPALAKADPTGPNQIFVRTAQVRTLINVDLGLINSVLSGVNTLLSPVMALLSPLGADLKILPMGANLDLSLEAASASSWVTDFTCASDDSKTLTATATTAAVQVKLGHITNPNAWTSSSTNLAVAELPLIDIGTGQPRVAFGGGGLGILIGGSGPADGSILSSTQSHTFSRPAEVKQPADPYYPFRSEDMLSSLQTTLGSIHLINHPPTSTTLLGALLGLVTGLLSQVLSTLGSAIGGLLSPLLDPLLNQVLTSLGIDLAKVEVGANLSCHPGQAKLVI